MYGKKVSNLIRCQNPLFIITSAASRHYYFITSFFSSFHRLTACLSVWKNTIVRTSSHTPATTGRNSMNVKGKSVQMLLPQQRCLFIASLLQCTRTVGALNHICPRIYWSIVWNLSLSSTRLMLFLLPLLLTASVYSEEGLIIEWHLSCSLHSLPLWRWLFAPKHTHIHNCPSTVQEASPVEQQKIGLNCSFTLHRQWQRGRSAWNEMSNISSTVHSMRFVWFSTVQCSPVNGYFGLLYALCTNKLCTVLRDQQDKKKRGKKINVCLSGTEHFISSLLFLIFHRPLTVYYYCWTTKWNEPKQTAVERKDEIVV